MSRGSHWKACSDVSTRTSSSIACRAAERSSVMSSSRAARSMRFSAMPSSLTCRVLGRSRRMKAPLRPWITPPPSARARTTSVFFRASSLNASSSSAVITPVASLPRASLRANSAARPVRSSAASSSILADDSPWGYTGMPRSSPTRFATASMFDPYVSHMVMTRGREESLAAGMIGSSGRNSGDVLVIVSQRIGGPGRNCAGQEALARIRARAAMICAVSSVSCMVVFRMTS